MRILNARRVSCAGLLLALICSSPLFLYSQVAKTMPLSAYGNCPAPSNQGFSICSPIIASGVAEIDAPFQLIAAATSGTGQVTHIELWVDGKKMTQVTGNPFDQPVTLAAGTHRIALIEGDTTNASVESTPFELTVETNDGQTCSPPAEAGVNVCVPQPNSCHTDPWTYVSAAGKGKSGTVARMELWINGVKIANFPGDKIDTNLYVTDFDTVRIVEVDSKGGSIMSQAIVVQSC